jgi:hypothetical protein
MFKKLFCKHNYYVYSRYIGQRLVTFHECVKCGKVKVS